MADWGTLIWEQTFSLLHTYDIQFGLSPHCVAGEHSREAQPGVQFAGGGGWGEQSRVPSRPAVLVGRFANCNIIRDQELH